MIVPAGVRLLLRVGCLLTQVVLVILRLTDVIDWSWWWVWSPLTGFSVLGAAGWTLSALVWLTVIGVEIGLEEAERGAEKRARRAS